MICIGVDGRFSGAMSSEVAFFIESNQQPEPEKEKVFSKVWIYLLLSLNNLIFHEYADGLS